MVKWHLKRKRAINTIIKIYHKKALYFVAADINKICILYVNT